MAAEAHPAHAHARPAHTMNLWQEALVYVIAVGVVVFWLTVKAYEDEDDLWPGGAA